MALGALGTLAGLAGLPQGYMQTDDWLRQRQLQQIRLQQIGQEQAAMRAAGQYLARQPQVPPGMAGGGSQPPPMQPTGSMADMSALPTLQKQVLGLEGNQDQGIGRAGELGPGQILPSTGRQYGYSPNQLLGDSGRQASGRIVGDLLNRAGGDASNPQQRAAALVGYNAGPKNEDRFIASGYDPGSVKLAPPYQRAVAAEIATKGAQFQKMGVPAPAVQQSSQAASQIAQNIDPSQFGQARLGDIAKGIDDANPGLDPAVKFMAVAQLAKVLAPGDRQTFQMMMLQNREMFQQQMQQMREQFQAGQGQANREVKINIAGLQQAGAEQRQQTRIAAADARQQQKLSAGQQPEPDPQKDAIAKAISEYRLAPLSGWALRTNWGKQTMDNVIALNPQYQSSEYAARVSGSRAFASGRQSDAVRFINVSIDHLSVADQLAEALQNQDFRTLNRLSNVVQTEFGISGPMNFETAKVVVGDEVTKAIIGGIGSQGDRMALQQKLDAANSPEQLRDVTVTLKRLMAGQLGGLQRQYETATGQKDFMDRLSPDAKKELGKYRTGQSESTTKYTVGQVIDTPKGKMRVTGGDLSGDPDVEEVK